MICCNEMWSAVAAPPPPPDTVEEIVGCRLVPEWAGSKTAMDIICSRLQQWLEKQLLKQSSEQNNGTQQQSKIDVDNWPVATLATLALIAAVQQKLSCAHELCACCRRCCWCCCCQSLLHIHEQLIKCGFAVCCAFIEVSIIISVQPRHQNVSVWLIFFSTFTFFSSISLTACTRC